MVILATPALADPLVYVSVLGRVQNSGQDYASKVTVTSTSQVIEYALVAQMAAIGATNTSGTKGVIPTGGPSFQTITSLVPTVTSTIGVDPFGVATTSTTYGDGISKLKFNLSQLPTDPIQVSLHSPVLTSTLSTGALGASSGTYSQRGTTGNYDVLNIQAQADKGVFVGVSSSGQPIQVVLGTGIGTVKLVTPGTIAHIFATDQGIDTLYNSLLNINGGALVPIGATTDADPVVGFNSLLIVTPEPATMTLLGLGFAGLLIRRRRKA
jgi:hypothetical protein